MVYHHDSNLPGNLLGVTLKYKIDGLIDKLHNNINKLNESTINRNDLSVKTIKSIETTIEILKTIEDCASYKDKEVGRNSFDEFGDIEYLAKGSFGEVHEATWIDGDREVVLERIHNSSDKFVDILKEVKQEFIVIITITLKQK